MKRLTTLLLLAITCLPFCVRADNLTVGVEALDQYPIYKGEPTQYTGFARELLDAFAAKYGHTLQYKPMPVLRLHDELLKTQSIDLKFPDNLEWNGEMRKGLNVSYSKPVLSVTEGLSLKPANKNRGIAAQKTIGTLRGFTPWQYLDAIKAKKIALAEVNSFDALVKMAESGRIDGLFANSIVVNYYLTEQLKQPNLLVFDDTLPYTKTNFHLSSVKQPKVIAQFDEFLDKEKDTVEKLKAKYRILK
jgi:ABC-type amino acid transport substrate-binding protein